MDPETTQTELLALEVGILRARLQMTLFNLKKANRPINDSDPLDQNYWIKQAIKSDQDFWINQAIKMASITEAESKLRARELASEV